MVVNGTRIARYSVRISNHLGILTAVLQTESMQQAHEPAAVAGIIGEQDTRAARRQRRLLSDESAPHNSFRLETAEPPAVTLLKGLLAPTVVVLVLALSSWLNGERFSLPILGLGVIVFLLSDRVLTRPEARVGTHGRQQLRPTLAALLLEWCCIFALMVFLVAVLRLSGVMPRTALITWFFITPAALLVANQYTISLERRLTSMHLMPRRHIIIGATEVGLELARRVALGNRAGEFLGFFDFRDPARLPKLTPEQWAGDCTGVADFVRCHGVDAIYIALPISMAPRIAGLLQELRDTTASVYFVPNILAFDLVQPRCTEIHGIPALAVCETPFRGMSALRKRAIDIVLASIALVLTGPLMLGVAIAVRLTSPGPALFKQRRYGLNGEEIFVYKFRSMRVCEDGALVTQASRNDRRITPLGRFLRRTSIDELPQILNVLEGKMSLVGPRPHAVAHNEQYRKLISGYMIRHKVRPGMTGWAQVNGLRGETDTLDKMRARVEYDIDYLKNWSLRLDFKILLRTAMLVLRDEQAY
jgi:putative colanic acid biosynthesis UDP-glucose lipid carrier transferase